VDPILTLEYIEEAIAAYAKDEDLENPMISPIFADFTGFPQTYIQVGTNEILLSDSLKLDKQMLKCRVPVRLEQFEGMWLSDYVDLRLGGPMQEQQHNGKPDCPLIGEDSNIFNLMAIASRTLKENGLPEQAREMRQRIEQSHSYDSALSIISDYVNITSAEQTEEMSMDSM
jgi:acetyl esterase/lipase